MPWGEDIQTHLHVDQVADPLLVVVPKPSLVPGNNKRFFYAGLVALLLIFPIWGVADANFKRNTRKRSLTLKSHRWIPYRVL